MSQKYTVISSTTTGDRLLNVGQAITQLSTGAVVFLGYDPAATTPNQVKLYASSDHATITTVSTVTAGQSGVFGLSALPQSLAICRDASDNIYVIGFPYTGDWGDISAKAHTKGTGLTWSPQGFGTDAFASHPGTYMTGVAARWCNTGGGKNGAGHIFAIFNNSNGDNFSSVLDAGQLLVGECNLTDSAKNPTFLGTGNSAVDGSNIDIAPDGFGATSGLAVIGQNTTHATVGAWGVSSSGKLTASTGLAVSLTTGTLSSTTKLRIVRYYPGQWAVFTPSPTSGHVRCNVYSSSAFQGYVDSGTASSFPTPSATLSWDVIAAPSTLLLQQVWLFGWSTGTATTMLRAPFNVTAPATPTLGTVVSDDTSVGAGTPTTIRSVQDPVDNLHSDYQGYSSVTPYALVGDYSALLASPSAPVLVTPANNSVAALASGGTVSWTFTSSVPGDAQTVYYFRRQTIGGAYQWWDGAAWQSTEQAVTSAAQTITFATSLWTAGTIYNWSVKTTGSTGLVGPYAADNQFTVANPSPSTPTLTSSYDPVLNRVTLTFHSSDSTGTTGSIEFSDDGGVTWNFLRFCTALTVYPGTSTAYDVEAAPGATRQYRARSWTVAPQSFSAYVTTNATPSVSTFWLRDVTGSLGSVTLKVLKGSLLTSFPEPATEHQPLGRADAIVVFDVMGLEDGAATVWTQNAADEATLMALLLSQKTLLIQTPDNRQWYVRMTGPRPTAQPYIVQPGQYREHALTWKGQQRP
jgi:hypothetical protein